MRLALVLVWLALPASAWEPDLPPAARIIAERQEPLARLALPAGPYDGEGVPRLTVEGQVVHRSWAWPLEGRSVAQLSAPLRAGLLAAGYEIVFDCVDAVCGGFDFRFATPTLPEPEMHVDLGDFHYLLARRGGAEGPDMLCLMVSRSAARAFLQVTRVAAPGATLPRIAAAPEVLPAVPPLAMAAGGTLAQRLEADGHVSLDDLVFQTGASRLGVGPFASLRSLATYLEDNPARRLLLVGHSDAVGALPGNVALSRKRAEAVRRHMIDELGVAPDRVSAHGVGFLAPRTTNRSAEGRQRNRRVEAVLPATE